MSQHLVISPFFSRLWCLANVMPAITAVYPHRSDRIISVTKPPLSRDCILITGVRYAVPAVYVPLTSLPEQVCT